MTQPIQEPNLYRGLARSTWNENQLYRRPAPVGSDDRAWARLAKPFPDGTFYPNQTINNNTNATLDFDLEWNLDAGDSGFDFFSAQGGPPVNALRFEVAGVYSITAEIYWLEAASFPFYLSFSGDGMDWAHRFTGYFDTFGSEDAMLTATMMHRYEAGDQIQTHVYQRSGGNRTINACYMEAVYLGSWTGVAFNDILPRE